jgi:hypothetical protein
LKQKPLDHFKFLTSQMCNTDYLDNLAETRYDNSLAMMNHSDSMGFKGAQKSKIAGGNRNTITNNLNLKNMSNKGKTLAALPKLGSGITARGENANNDDAERLGF